MREQVIEAFSFNISLLLKKSCKLGTIISIKFSFFSVISMKKLLFLPILLMIFFCFAHCFAQEPLINAERVHGPLEYYLYQGAKFSSLVVPPVVTVYKVLGNGGNSCPDALALGMAGIVWAVTSVAVHKFGQLDSIQKQNNESTVAELTRLIADFPEVVDRLAVHKRSDYMFCPKDKIATCKLSFTVPELQQMFRGYLTYYGIDNNGKPAGYIVVEDTVIAHPLITAWAKTCHYWKHW